MTDWIVKGLIPQGDLVFALGYPHAGKSWVMNQLACAAVTGRNLFFTEEFETKKCGSVVLIDEDTPTDLLHKRLSRVATAFSTVPEEIDVRSMTDWRLDRNVGLLLSEMETRPKPILLIFESLSKIIPPEWDPNKTADAIKIVRHINRLREVATVVGSHHLSEKKEYKFGDEDFDRKAMGNTQLNAGCDTIFGVSELISGAIFGIQPKSKRTALEGKPFAVELKEDKQHTWAYLKYLEDVPISACSVYLMAKKVAPWLYVGTRITVEGFYKSTEGMMSRDNLRLVLDYLTDTGFAILEGSSWVLNKDIKAEFCPLSSIQEELMDCCKKSSDLILEEIRRHLWKPS